jgi:hypothetical protein
MIGAGGGRCIARQVKTRAPANATAGTIVQTISLDRRGTMTSPARLPGIGDRAADRMTAI